MVTEIQPLVFEMYHHSPRNFSWLEEHVIAGLAFPNSKENLEFLVENGIRYLVTTSKEMHPNVESVPALENVNISVEDYGTFDIDQICAFIEICKTAVEGRKGIAVHCRAGLGRTGTLLACYLVYFRGYAANAAIEKVRELRPGSIETTDQLKAVENFYRHLLDNLLNV